MFFKNMQKCMALPFHSTIFHVFTKMRNNIGINIKENENTTCDETVKNSGTFI